MELFAIMLAGALIALFLRSLFAHTSEPQVRYVIVERDAPPRGGSGGIGFLLFIGVLSFVLFSGAF